MVGTLTSSNQKNHHKSQCVKFPPSDDSWPTRSETKLKRLKQSLQQLFCGRTERQFANFVGSMPLQRSRDARARLSAPLHTMQRNSITRHRMLQRTTLTPNHRLNSVLALKLTAMHWQSRPSCNRRLKPPLRNSHRRLHGSGKLNSRKIPQTMHHSFGKFWRINNLLPERITTATCASSVIDSSEPQSVSPLVAQLQCRAELLQRQGKQLGEARYTNLTAQFHQCLIQCDGDRVNPACKTKIPANAHNRSCPSRERRIICSLSRPTE